MHYTLSDITTPADDTVLWRYLDLERFLALLESGALYLCRLDKFRDKWEGTWPESFADGLLERMTPERAAHFIRDSDGLRRVHFVSCWHASSYESAALWDQYSGGSGIALRSSVVRLRSAVTPRYRFMIGEVEYIDFTAAGPMKRHPVVPVFRKRMSFEHEREVRLLVSHSQLKDDDPSLGEPFEEIHLEVNINTLVESVFISPTAPAWLAKTVRGVLSAFGYEGISVSRSSLYDSRVR